MPPKTSPLQPLSPLYSHYFTAKEKHDILTVPPDDFSSEINLLRILMRHYLQTCRGASGDLVSTMQALQVCTLLCEQLGVLVRVQLVHYAPHCLRDQLIDEALAMLPVFFEDDYPNNSNAIWVEGFQSGMDPPAEPSPEPVPSETSPPGALPPVASPPGSGEVPDQ
jgi:hypothetical protein